LPDHFTGKVKQFTKKLKILKYTLIFLRHCKIKNKLEIKLYNKWIVTLIQKMIIGTKIEGISYSIL
jgi:hypothetical protein